eukprot:366462-Chlamydomonas_euryale.AAC.46
MYRLAATTEQRPVRRGVTMHVADTPNASCMRLLLARMVSQPDDLKPRWDTLSALGKAVGKDLEGKLLVDCTNVM